MTVFAESGRADIYTHNSELTHSATPVAELEAFVLPSRAVSGPVSTPEPARSCCVPNGPHSRLKGKEVPRSNRYATLEPLNGDRMNQTAAPQNPYPELDAVLYTRLETAQLLKISRKTVANLIRSGQLSAQKAGSRVLIPRAALVAFLEAGQK